MTTTTSTAVTDEDQIRAVIADRAAQCTTATPSGSLPTTRPRW
jgi:hypothetical protein